MAWPSGYCFSGLRQLSWITSARSCNERISSFHGGTRGDDGRSAFGQADIDHVIVGGGLDRQTRAEIVREVFQASGSGRGRRARDLTSRPGW